MTRRTGAACLHHTAWVLVLSLVALGSGVARAEDEAPSWGAVQTQLRKAFKTLSLPKFSLQVTAATEL